LLQLLLIWARRPQRAGNENQRGHFTNQLAPPFSRALATAIYTAEGDLLAQSQQLWIELKRPA